MGLDVLKAGSNVMEPNWAACDAAPGMALPYLSFRVIARETLLPAVVTVERLIEDRVVQALSGMTQTSWDTEETGANTLWV